MMRAIRYALWGLVAIAIAVYGFMFLGARNEARQFRPVEASQPVTRIGGPFTLTGTDGKPFSSARMAGKPFAIFFGFTHCPDVCPTTLARLAKLRKTMGKGDDAFAILFVSVDPERDTPVEMGRYAALFGTPIIALTGSAAQIEQVKRAYGIYSAKVPQQGADYSVDHSAAIFLMDAQGKFAATITPDEGDSAALAKLRHLIG